MQDQQENSVLLWQPRQERIESSQLYHFLKKINEKYAKDFQDFDALYDWSLSENATFWSEVWDFAELIGEKGQEPYLIEGEHFKDARFFPNARLNYAENLLRSRDEDSIALSYWTEAGAQCQLSYAELVAQVSSLQQFLKAQGIKQGDRVAALMPNCPQTLVVMLAAASIGVVFSSTSPDFGISGVLDRFGQIEPKVLLTCDGVLYGGKERKMLNKVQAVIKGLPSLKAVLFWPQLDPDFDPSQLNKDCGIELSLWDQVLKAYPAKALDFTPMPFDSPLFIVYSSGTTGIPKCIIHRAGGVLLKQLSEHILHSDNRAGDSLFYFSTCGWMMWNWLVAGLAVKAKLVLYDGSPFMPKNDSLFVLAQDEGVTFFGVSAKYLDQLRKENFKADAFDLSALRTIASTGSVLTHEGFDYVYEAIKADLCLSSISGGTDILGCFMAGNPLGAVYRGQIQKRCLGSAVAIFDPKGAPIENEQGELVCTKPFPSIPLGFWNDPEDKKFLSAYFEGFEGVWTHGDYATLTPEKGIIIHGRSDATLNPGGVRIGTAEIYRQVERFEQIAEALAIGQDWGADQRIILFVRLQAGFTLTQNLIAALNKSIREGASARHVPAKIIAINDIPRTRSGKIAELAVRDVIHKREVKNISALANAEALALYANLPQLQPQTLSDQERKAMLDSFANTKLVQSQLHSAATAPRPKNKAEMMDCEERDAMLFEALPSFLRLAQKHSPFWTERLDEDSITALEQAVNAQKAPAEIMAHLALTTKEHLITAQQKRPPQGGICTSPTSMLRAMGRSQSGFVYVAGNNDWGRAAAALQAADINAQDLVLFAFDASAQAEAFMFEGAQQTQGGCLVKAPDAKLKTLIDYCDTFAPTALICQQHLFESFLKAVKSKKKSYPKLKRALIIADNREFDFDLLQNMPHLHAAFSLVDPVIGVIATRPIGEQAYVLSENLIAELLEKDAEGKLVPSSAEYERGGQLVITRLDKFMPLFRYISAVKTKRVIEKSRSERNNYKFTGICAFDSESDS